MRGGEGDCCVVVVGAGAAGALTASHLVTSLSPRYRVALVDPSPTTGRGAAYSTTDERHLLNVPASGMSAFPRDPEHFFRWVRNHHDKEAQPQDFIPRHVYGDYIHGLLQTAAEYPGNARLERREEAVVAIARRGDRFTVRLSSGQAIVARAVVLATGSSPRTDWAPAGLSSADVADPWTDELPDGDLLLVGTGLRTTSLAHADPFFRDVVAPVCCALQAVVEGDFGSAANQLAAVLPRATALGGSAAQRDVLQDTLVYALARSGQGEQAAAVLDERLSRRASPRDARQRARIREGQGASSPRTASAPAWASGGQTQPRPGWQDRG